MTWKPHVTVAAIIEQDNRFLMVEEHTSNGIAFNQPAGHLENNESLITAVKREVNEETAWHFEPKHIVGIQLWRKSPDADSFLRVCFTGQHHSHNPEQALDSDIIKTHWLTRQEIAAKGNQLRSPLVLICIDDYLAGKRHSLSLLNTFLDLDHD